MSGQTPRPFKGMSDMIQRSFKRSGLSCSVVDDCEPVIRVGREMLESDPIWPADGLLRELSSALALRFVDQRPQSVLPRRTDPTAWLRGQSVSCALWDER